MPVGGGSGESAASLFRRTWGATPVALGHPVLSHAAGGGLRATEALLIAGPPGSGKSLVALQLVADHLAGGGTALLAVAPGTGLAIDMHWFAAVLERTICKRAAGGAPLQFQEAVRRVGGPAALMAQVRAAASRLHIADIADFAELAALFSPWSPPPPPSWKTAAAPPAGSGEGGAPNVLAPLLVVDGLGTSCALSVLERVEGFAGAVGEMLARAVDVVGCAVVAIETRLALAEPLTALAHQSSVASACPAGFFTYFAQARADPLPPTAPDDGHPEARIKQEFFADTASLSGRLRRSEAAARVRPTIAFHRSLTLVRAPPAPTQASRAAAGSSAGPVVGRGLSQQQRQQQSQRPPAASPTRLTAAVIAARAEQQQQQQQQSSQQQQQQQQRSAHMGSRPPSGDATTTFSIPGGGAAQPVAVAFHIRDDGVIFC